MQQGFSTFIKKNILILSSDKILLTVSGGVDSVVMCNLFHKAGIKFGIAHCNFNLRGEESNDDEKFVEKLAKKYKVPFYGVLFFTQQHAERNKISVQMAARELRYNWFEEIRQKDGYTYIATAHHQDDSIETFFINVIRGTGIAGLHGILPKQGNIIRPLLFATKNEIIEYAAKEKIKYREDSSNASDKYMRNKIRHSIIPVLRELNPKIDSSISTLIKRVQDVEAIYKIEIEKQRLDILSQKEGSICISIEKLKKLNPISSYLYGLLSPFNFNESQIEEIINCLDKESGKQFYSDTHRLIRDRKDLIIDCFTKSIVENSHLPPPINYNTASIDSEDFTISFEIKNREPNINKSLATATLDFDKLVFPLELRKWKQGDTFYPFGMKGKKKLSDYFIDNKVPLNKKENTWLLTSDGKIVWVVGMRIDNRFKITKGTKRIYFVELLK